MAMKLVKKTAEYSIFKRRDNRYAVRDANKKPVTGDDKVRILVAENLVKITAPAPREAPVVEEAAVEDAPAVESAEPPAAEPTVDEAATETPQGDETK